MALDKDNPNPAYQLGCQFALFELAQYIALGKLNANVKDKYFARASAAPSSVFVTLHNNFNHHVSDLRKGKKFDGWNGDPRIMAAWLEKRTGEITNKISTCPITLSLADQGLFILGYYHQRFLSKGEDKDFAHALKNEPDETEALLEETNSDSQ